MAYTVKQLAKLSGVSVRTLHWYDKMGLLKPAYHGDNGYRYYEQNQLLLLQQILFFRELDLPLDEIRRIIGGNEFDRFKALNLHKKTLRKRVEKTKVLIKTIDGTLLHIRGKQIMADKELFKGFNEWAEGKGGESYHLGYCDNPDECDTVAETLVLKSVKKTDNKKWTKSDWEKFEGISKEIYGKISECIKNGLEPTSDKVQKLIKKHHAYTEQFHNATKEVYKALAQVYHDHPAYRKQLDHFDPRLAEFMRKAMTIFADQELS